MKFGLSFLLNVAFGFLLTLFFPWWSVVILSFIVGFSMKVKGWQAFLGGFAGMSALWIGYAGILDFQNGAILSQRVSELFQLSNPSYLVHLTGFIGGLLGGMGALTGRLFRDIMKPGKSRYGSRRSTRRYNLPIEED